MGGMHSLSISLPCADEPPEDQVTLHEEKEYVNYRETLADLRHSPHLVRRVVLAKHHDAEGVHLAMGTVRYTIYPGAMS